MGGGAEVHVASVYGEGVSSCPFCGDSVSEYVGMRICWNCRVKWSAPGVLLVAHGWFVNVWVGVPEGSLLVVVGGEAQ